VTQPTPTDFWFGSESRRKKKKLKMADDTHANQTHKQQEIRDKMTLADNKSAITSLLHKQD